MSYATKYRLSQGALVVCMAGIVLSLLRMAPAGMGGDTRTVKFWFAAMVFFLLIGVLAATAFYYYRNRRFDTKDQQQIALETLAKLGEQQRKK
jgi:hypothetical protein